MGFTKNWLWPKERELIKMARPITFVGTLSIFESLVFNQIDLYFKNIITHVLHIDLTLL